MGSSQLLCCGSVKLESLSMRWVVIFEDAPAMLEVRKKYEPAHLAYLQAHDVEILVAGGLREAPGSVFVGGLWILEVISRERAIDLVENDPYFVNGARSYKVLVWGKAFQDKQVVL